MVGLSTIFSQRPQQIGENLLCKSEFCGLFGFIGRPVTVAPPRLHIGHMLPRVALTVGARGILKGRPRSHGRVLKETEAAKPTVGRNGALARFGLGVGRVEFWISTRVENSAIFGERFFACVGLGPRWEIALF